MKPTPLSPANWSARPSLGAGLRTTLSIALLSAAVLTGCGGSGPGPELTVSAQPVGLVMRPGEADSARLTASDASVAPSLVLSVGPQTWFDTDFTGPCATASPTCRLLPVTLASTGGARHATKLTFSFTNDPGSRVFDNDSYMPLVGFSAQPDRAPPVLRFAAGGDREGGVSAAVTADGQVWTWGVNQRAEMATDDRSDRALPDPVAHGLTDIAALDVGLSADNIGVHVLALAADGTVYAWGANLYGQVVDDPAAAQLVIVPAAVPLPFRDVIAVAAGGTFSMALRADGTVWVWGSNGDYELGQPDAIDGPQQVPGIDRVRALAAGERHALVLRDDGTVWAWGDNAFGQAGRPLTVFRALPGRVEGLGAVTAIDAGPGYSLALRSDGTVWAWGLNDANQLGSASTATCGSRACRETPARVGGNFADVLGISAGGRFAVARQRDGSAWAWGENDQGQLGGLPGLGSLAPIRVTGLPSTLTIAAGARHALAMPSDQTCGVGNARVGGRLLAWGDNFNGERGDGTGVNHLRPTPVLSLGDDDSCPGILGQRLIVYKAGTGTGSVASDAPGLNCNTVMCWQQVPTGTPVTLTATPDAGFAVDDWRWDCAAGPVSANTVVLDSTRHCKLRFAEPGATPVPAPDPAPEAGPRLDIRIEGLGSVTSAPAGIDCGSRCSGSFANGTEVALTATPAPGWQFNFFSGACEGGLLTMTADTACVAYFTDASVYRSATLTVVRTGAMDGGQVVVSVLPNTAINCGDYCTASYLPGAVVHLRALSDSATVVFNRWAGCDEVQAIDGESICILDMQADRTVEADFQ